MMEMKASLCFVVDVTRMLKKMFLAKHAMINSFPGQHKVVGICLISRPDIFSSLERAIILMHISISIFMPISLDNKQHTYF